MNRTKTSITRATAAGLALVLALAGCSSKDEEPAASSSSSSSASSTASAQASATPDPEEPAEAADYDALLIAPEDIPAPAPFVLDPPQLNFNGTPGVLAEYHTEDRSAAIVDAITVTPDKDFADKLLASMTADIASMVKGAPVNSPIGTKGILVEGTSLEGTNARTVLLFSQDNSVVMLQFESLPGDMAPAPTDFVNTVGQLQLDTINANLASVPVPPAPTPTP